MQELRVGNLLLQSNIFMAPLVSYTAYPFRLLCQQLGAGLCFTEMISSNGLKYMDTAKPKEISFDKVLARLEKNFSPIPCNRCQECKCYYNKEIDRLFRQYNYYFLGKEHWALKKLDLEIEEQVNLCDKCVNQICLHTCPRKIDIPNQFKKIEEIVEYHIGGSMY